MVSLIIFTEILIGVLTMGSNLVIHHHQYLSTQNAAIILTDESAPAEAPPAEAPPNEALPNEAPAPAEAPPAEAPPIEMLPTPGIEAPPTEVPAPLENVNQGIPNPTETQPENQPGPGEQVNQQSIDQISQGGALNSPGNIDPAVTATIENQDNQVAAIDNPAEKADALIRFADQDVSLLDQKVSPTDFATANIVAQTVTEHLDQALNQIGSLPPTQSRALKQKLRGIADHADRIFRTEQLVVPEQMEQEFEITRGVLLNIKQLK